MFGLFRLIRATFSRDFLSHAVASLSVCRKRGAGGLAVARRKSSRTTLRSYGRSPICYEATTSSPSTGGSSCPWWLSAGSTASSSQPRPRSSSGRPNSRARSRTSTRCSGRPPGEGVYNTSALTMTKLLDDPSTIADNLKIYIAGFSESARDVIEKFEFDTHIDRLDRANLLSSAARAAPC
jgi:hypothetical protein